LDLDAVKIADTLATDATQVAGLVGMNVFDFSPTGTVLNPGTQLPTVDPDLFGTIGGNVDNLVATLGMFDAVAATAQNAYGFVSLGEGGDITFHFDPPLVITAPMYFYIGEVTDVGEVTAGNVQVTGPGVPTGVGIRIENNASPTLLNNVFSTLETGIDVDATSLTTVLGGTLFHYNTTDVNGIGPGDFAIIADPSAKLFVDQQKGNYYPAPGSPLIDSSVDSLEDRPEMIQLEAPLGIAESPILAPTYDASGQLRLDDPDVAPPPGMGQNIFKDRGAQDRADFQGPASSLVMPLDDGPSDLDQSPTRVNLLRTSLDHFAIQLVDREGPLSGIGLDDSTVTKGSVRIFQDGVLLAEGRDYIFAYNATSNTIRLTPLAGVWRQESNYVIELVGEAQFVVFARSGDKLTDGDNFLLVDELGVTTTFEYDSGYVMQVPQTLALQVPLAGGAAGGVTDGDTITVSNATRTVTLELDKDGAYVQGNIPIPFTTLNTQGEIADAIVTGLRGANVQLNPVNAGAGLVHLGVNGTQTMTVVSATIAELGVPNGVVDGQQFTIDDGAKLVTFEFNSSGGVGLNRVPIQFSLSQTHEQIGQAVAAAINAQSLGLNTQHVGDGIVHIGGGLNHIVTVIDANVTVTGEPGAELAFGLRIPTVAGSFKNQIADGETFTISDGVSTAVTFELDDNGRWTAGNTPIPYTNTTSTWQLANTLVNRIRNAGLGLFPYNAGNGIVILGGTSLITLDVTNTALTQVGMPGVAASVPIPFVPSDTFTAEMAAAATADAINAQGLTGVSAEVEQDRVLVTGAVDGDGTFVGFVDSIRDLAGNPLVGNQTDGDARFTIFVGVGMDYGDAPSPYPTLRSQNGARHVIIDGFSLGTRIDLNADGQPSANADGDDQQGNDEDGVVFDSATPLIPNRSYNVTISTSGIGTAVPYGVIDAWVDWNRDGDWNDVGEQILANQILTPSLLTNGSTTFRNLIVPAGAVSGDTFARFRLSTAGSLTPFGETNAGEVEDYKVSIVSNPWQNPTNRYDVNASGAASPVDVLLVINYLNNTDSTVLSKPLPVPRPADRPFLDVDGSGYAEPVDALLVINHLNSLNSGLEGEAAPSMATRVASPSVGSNHLDDILAMDEDWAEMLGDVDRANGSLDVRDAVFAGL